MTTDPQVSARLAELHRKRSAIDAEIAELYQRQASGEPTKRPRAKRVVPDSKPVSQETQQAVSRELAKRGITT